MTIAMMAVATSTDFAMHTERLSKKEGGWEGAAVCCYVYAMNNAMMCQIM